MPNNNANIIKKCYYQLQIVGREQTAHIYRQFQKENGDLFAYGAQFCGRILKAYSIIRSAYLGFPVMVCSCQIKSTSKIEQKKLMNESKESV